jgi:hypothetical protein
VGSSDGGDVDIKQRMREGLFLKQKTAVPLAARCSLLAVAVVAVRCVAGAEPP